MKKHKLIIIGAGITGLSAAYFAQKSGFDVEVYEKHNKPGGLCTSWSRKGYTFDGCIHWLVGSKPGTEFYKLWQETGAFDSTEIIQSEYFARVEDTNGQHLILYSDVRVLENHLLDLFPEDKKMIRKLVKMIEKQTGLNFSLDKPPQLYNLGGILRQLFKMLPYIKHMKDCRSISIKDYMNKFKNPFLRTAFLEVFDAESALYRMVGIMAFYNDRDAGYPMGGSLALARSIEKKLQTIGIKIHYRSPVERIIVKQGKATGIILDGGKEITGDIILSAADGYSTIFKLLEGKFTTKAINDLYSRHTSPTVIQVSFGVGKVLKEMPSTLIRILKEPVSLAGKKIMSVIFKNYNYDRSLSPRGKSVITCLINTDYDYWEKLSYGSAAYKKEKKKISEFTEALLEERYPGVRKKIEVVDVVTPLTFYRYTSSFRGSIMSWIGSAGEKMPSHPQKLPGLDCFYMAGQWTMPPGGLPVALLSAKWIIQIMENDLAKQGHRD